MPSVPPMGYPRAPSLAQAQFILGRQIEQSEICKKVKISFFTFNIAKRQDTLFAERTNWRN